MIRSVRRLLGLLTPRERGGALVLFGLLVVGALFEVVGVGAIPAFVAALASPDTVLANERVGPLLRDLGLVTQRDLAVWGGIALVTLFVVKNVYLSGLAYATARYTQGRTATLSVRLFRHYLLSPYPFHLKRNSAELLRNTNHEVSAALAGVLTPALNIALEVLVIALVGALILVVEPLISLTVITVLGGLTLAFYALMRRKVTWYAAESQRHRTATMQSVNQGLAGIKDVKVLGREAYFSDVFNRSVWFLASANRFKAVVGALPRLFLEVVVVSGVLVVAMILVSQGRPTTEVIPVLALLAAAAMRLMPSFQRIMANQQAFQWGEVSLNLIADDLRGEPATAVDAAPDPPDTTDIELDGLAFQYEGASEPALKDVSISIPQGAAVAFVGQSGAGKTTLVDLLLGLLSPTEGAIRVGGKSLADPGVLRAWRGLVGYIPQAIYLTDDSIRRNVAFGVAEDQVDDGAVWRALEAAQLAAFVRGLPEGVETRVGDRGTRLSGGQRQRIGIARALYHDPPVLVMDEATSALDNQTERNVVAAVEALRGERTVVMIAHRLSTVEGCDTLYVFEHGRLVDQGTYAELEAASAAFAEITA